ncbi:hypothetical protein MMC19_003732 [Ptychographa xylographoides]|nr:hypothetical protein [Ptychographa xylographoides]
MSDELFTPSVSLIPPGSKFRHIWQSTDDEDPADPSNDSNGMVESADVAESQPDSSYHHMLESFGEYELTPHEIRLELDTEAAKKGCFLLSCIRKPKFPDSYSDDPERFLPSVAAAAHEWMRENWERLVEDFGREHPAMRLNSKQKKKMKPPFTVCAMIANGQVYICSSARRADSFVSLFRAEDRVNQFIMKALRLADLDENKDESSAKSIGHRYQANCAEALTLHLWSVANTDEYVRLDTFALVTVKERKGGGVEVYPPCNPSSCAILLRRMLIRDVDHRAPEERICLEVHPYARLTDEVVPQRSVTETAVGKLWLSCGARCNGTGRFLGGDCFCQTVNCYSAWYKKAGSPHPWASIADDSLTEEAYKSFAKYVEQYPDENGEGGCGYTVKVLSSAGLDYYV